MYHTSYMYHTTKPLFIPYVKKKKKMKTFLFSADFFFLLLVSSSLLLYYYILPCREAPRKLRLARQTSTLGHHDSRAHSSASAAMWCK